jgi:purine nucleosidase
MSAQPFASDTVARSRRPVIIDTDPGIDDAVAIALCGASPELRLLGLTTTHGNVDVAQTTSNALAILNFLKLDVPVFAGSQRALVRDALPLYADVANGLGGLELPPHDRIADSRHAVSFIIDAVMSDPGNVTIVAIAPFTNIALAMRMEPRLAASIREIVVMGGAIGEGNKTPSAESNALGDPHAMRMMFESGAPITMFGLDVTHRVLALPHRLALVGAANTPVTRFMVALMELHRPLYKERFGWDGAAIHDLCTIAWLVRPDLFMTKPMTVRVDTNEGPNFGRTICDSRCRDSDVLPTVRVAYDAHADDVFALLAERLSTYEDALDA